MLGTFATERAEAGDVLAPQVTAGLLVEVVSVVPDDWLHEEPGFDSVSAVRAAYVDHLLRRVDAKEVWQP